MVQKVLELNKIRKKTWIGLDADHVRRVGNGPFAIRLQFPAGYSVAPHWHPTDEQVMVLVNYVNPADDPSKKTQ